MLKAKLSKNLRDYDMKIEFEVKAGEVLVLLGENGSGKSTILNLLAGLLIPDQGEITLNSRTLFQSEANFSLLPEDRNIGYVFQNYALFPHMTVFENIAFGLKMRKFPRDQIGVRIDQILEGLEMAHFKHERVTNLSGGQRQRVALARALIIEPHLLLLDEPLTALDQGTREKIRVELREQLVKSNQPSILVTHSLKDAMIIGDRVMVLQQGKVIWSGRPDELKTDMKAPDLTDLSYQREDYRNFGAIAID